MYRLFLVVVAFVLYQLARAIYLLYFHPLSHVPGPKIAAVTRWYENYYLFAKGGMFSRKIEALHEIYGPIVRIKPNEVHIKDPSFYDEVYNFNPMLDKAPNGFDNLEHTPSFAIHKHRRRVFEPFFARRNIERLQPMVEENLTQVCAQLNRARNLAEPMNMSLLYRCLLADSITECVLSSSYGFLENLDEGKNFIDSYDFRIFVVLKDMPWVAGILMSVIWLTSFLPDPYDKMSAVNKVRAVLGNRIDGLTAQNAEKPTFHDNDARPSLIKHFFTADNIPSEEKEKQKLLSNTELFVVAGFETTGSALSLATYHVLANPDVCQRLKAELYEAWPSPNVTPPWRELEKLPYLKAVIQESLRLSFGASARFGRMNKTEDTYYKDVLIPKGTLYGMSQRMIHLDPAIFPDPWRWNPDRWLKGEESKYLEKYLVSFSKGARGCIGKHLAWLELNVVLATIFRRFDLDLFKTTRRDVDNTRDYFVPLTEPGSKGVRVMVK